MESSSSSASPSQPASPSELPNGARSPKASESPPAAASGTAGPQHRPEQEASSSSTAPALAAPADEASPRVDKLETSLPPPTDKPLAIETPAPPEKVEGSGHEAAGASPRGGEMGSASNPAAAAAPAPAAVVDRAGASSSSSSLAMYDIIQSPDGPSEIVERSPGGRYVRFAEKLGSGASKDVYRAYDTQEGIEVAWNVVNLSGVPKSERNRIVNEVRLLERLHHHNIISFHGSWVNRERQEVNFVTEILSSGTLKSFINKVQVIRWKIAKRWAAQILQGLNYLHSQDPPVIHRDLKCENIFINGTSGDLRIGDLGLSTVHRNGRVLSVLGTPEFMAPDMYEEQPYDEKVDIYAFGMCLLEIFTKEIPYRECMNPAQIYKKVSGGELPEVLSRFESRNAREFILLCLGYKDESTGRYVRPSAAELLQHPFLEKRASDDNEVIVDPPLYKRVISEGGESQTSPMGTPITKSKAPGSVDLLAPPNPESGASGAELFPDVSKTPSQPLPPPQVRSRATSLSDNDDDKFDEMPQSEAQFRKVKVMMGRNRELEEEDDQSHVRNQSLDSIEQPSQSSPPTPISVTRVTSDGTQTVASPNAAPVASQSTLDRAVPAATQAPAPPQQYLVAAAVLENESSNLRPYPDDILKLVVTLPVDGQTQNVQFDFHLVEDDPVKVAKEMVQELGIPPGAVLEISETISGLACAARIKIEKFTSRKIHGASPQIGIEQGQPLAQQPHPTGQSPAASVPTNHGIPSSTLSMLQQPAPSHQQSMPMPTHDVSYGSTSEGHVTPGFHDQAHVALQPPLPPQPIRTTPVAAAPFVAATATHELQPGIVGQDAAHVIRHLPVSNPNLFSGAVPVVPTGQVSSQVQHQILSIPSGSVAPSSQPNATPIVAVQPTMAADSSRGHNATPQTQNIAFVGSHEPLSIHHATAMPQRVSSSATQSVSSSSSVLAPGVFPTPQPAAVSAPTKSHGHVAPVNVQHSPVMQLYSTASHPISTSSDRPTIQPHRSGQSLPSYQTALQSDDSAAVVQQPSHSRHQTSPDILPVPSAVSQRVTTAGTQSTFGSDDSEGRRLHQLSLTSPGQSPPPDSDDGESDADPSVEEEFRKLEEEFERSLQRAKKVFDSRMDNLQRSQIEREAQHQKTLEKHEKERAEYEKRLAQEEEQQMRRMEHLQREWEKKRQALALSKRRHLSQSSGGSNNGMRLSQESFDSQYTIGSGGLNPLSHGAGHHRRQASGNMSSQTLPPAALDEIYQPPMNGGQEAPR